jgi:hypothetical protein
MPGITVSEKGMVSHNFKKLEEPYADVVAGWHLPEDFASKLPIPRTMAFKCRKTGEKLIYPRTFAIDPFTVLGALAVCLLGALLIFAAANHGILLLHVPLWGVWTFYTVLSVLILYVLMSLSVRDLIYIAKDHFYLFRRMLFFRVRYGTIPIRAIKGIDINYTPTTERYYLLISSAGNNYIVGNKLPVETLRWLRAVLISEILGH